LLQIANEQQLLNIARILLESKVSLDELQLGFHNRADLEWVELLFQEVAEITQLRND